MDNITHIECRGHWVRIKMLRLTPKLILKSYKWGRFDWLINKRFIYCIVKGSRRLQRESRMNCLCSSAWKLFGKLKKSWFNRFALLMGKRQKRWLKLIRKLHKLPIFFFGGGGGGIKVGNPKRVKWAYLVHQASQAALRIRFILPTGAITKVRCRIIIWPYRPTRVIPKKTIMKAGSEKPSGPVLTRLFYIFQQRDLELEIKKVRKWVVLLNEIWISFGDFSQKRKVFRVETLYYFSSWRPSSVHKCVLFRLKKQFWNFQQLVVIG